MRVKPPFRSDVGMGCRTSLADLTSGAADLTQIRAVRCGAADRVERRASDQQVVVSAVRPERVVAGRGKFGAGLPPAVLADYDARIEALVKLGSGARRCPRASRSIPSRRWRCRVPGRLRGASSTSGSADRLRRLGSGAMLGLAEQCRLCARQDQREMRRQVGPRLGPICGFSKSGNGA